MRPVALILCAALTAAAAAPAGARTIMGAGALPCRRWVDDRKADSYFTAAQWVLGYLSRADRDYPGGTLHATDSTAVVTWLDQYCAAHPDDDLETAAFRLEVDTARPAASPPRARRRPHARPPRP
jgi:hypothetical protein